MNDKSAVFPLGLLQKFDRLKTLELRRSPYKEIFSDKETDELVGMHVQVKYLECLIFMI